MASKVSQQEVEAEEVDHHGIKDRLQLCRLSLLSSSAAVDSDGKVAIEFHSTHPEELESQLPPYPTLTSEPIAEPDAKVPPLNIVIQVVGSRGDVQPFIAYGTALLRYGHRVRLATHDTFAKFVTDSGLEFYPIGGDPEDLMAYMVRNPGLIPSIESLRGGDVGKKRKMVKDMIHGCWMSCIEADPISARPFTADAIIANPPSFAHVHCAQALGIPAHIMFTMPWTATRAFPHPLANIKRGNNLKPAATNWLSYGVVELLTWQGLGDVINEWREQDLDLEAVPATIGPGINTFLKIPHTYCWSPSIIAKPADWGSEIDVCGFFMRDEPEYEPPEDLGAFLKAGTAPLYVGFGSIVVDNPKRLTDIIIAAAKACGVRVLISRGWSKLGEGNSNTDDVFYLGDCPHEWLFKRVSAVVHHGGAGTTACGLVNARPTLIVPFFGDQPFWGGVVASAGAGPLPIPQKELNESKLIDAIQFLLSAGANLAVQGVADKMRQEKGVDRAVESFHRNLQVSNMACDILPDHVASWRYVRGGYSMKLSNIAVSRLISAGRIRPSELKPLYTREYDTGVERWGPITGGASATLGFLTDFTVALGGTLANPWKEYIRVHASQTGSAGQAAALAAGKGLATVGRTLVKGPLVDFPLALADGLHNLPREYGGTVREHGKVEDWKSGGKVAGENFRAGFYDGFTGFVMDPINGAKEGGNLGLLKGIGRGTMGLLTKPGSAIVGLLAYPAQGIQKSLSAKKGRMLAVRSAKLDMMADEGRRRHEVEATVETENILRGFDAVYIPSSGHQD